MKILDQSDCSEATFYFYIFLLYYLRVRDGYPYLLIFLGVTVLSALPIHGVITYVHFYPIGG